MRIWRICRKRHLASAFSGEGARRGSARWNSAGVPIAYASEALSLAAIEYFVHVDSEDMSTDLMAICAEVPIAGTELVKRKDQMLSALPVNWKFENGVTRGIGDEWANRMESLWLPVPSVVIDGEWNMLINPLHSDIAQMKIVETKPFRFDERMFKASR